jgi:hypothetical protein
MANQQPTPYELAEEPAMTAAGCSATGRNVTYPAGPRIGVSTASARGRTVGGRVTPGVGAIA